jgi:very-short-patch-repair endonuclease
MEAPKLNGPQEHIYTTDPRTWEKRLKAYARENRKQPTLAEHKLWQYLRGAKTGAKFRRQHAISFFIVDFVCIEAKLIIELDGEIHLYPEHAEYDTGRTFTLTELGYRELRFTNQQVLTSLDDALAEIAEALKENYPESPSGTPLFWRGGRPQRGPVTLPARTCPN